MVHLVASNCLVLQILRLGRDAGIKERRKFCQVINFHLSAALAKAQDEIYKAFKIEQFPQTVFSVSNVPSCHSFALPLS